MSISLIMKHFTPVNKRFIPMRCLSAQSKPLAFKHNSVLDLFWSHPWSQGFDPCAKISPQWWAETQARQVHRGPWSHPLWVQPKQWHGIPQLNALISLGRKQNGGWFLEVCVPKIHRWVYRVRSLSDGDCAYQSLLWVNNCVVDRKRLGVCHLVFIWAVFEQEDTLKALTVSRMKKTVSSHFVKESSPAQSGLAAPHFLLASILILVWSGKSVKTFCCYELTRAVGAANVFYVTSFNDLCRFLYFQASSVWHNLPS